MRTFFSNLWFRFVDSAFATALWLAGMIVILLVIPYLTIWSGYFLGSMVLGYTPEPEPGAIVMMTMCFILGLILTLVETYFVFAIVAIGSMIVNIVNDLTGHRRA